MLYSEIVEKKVTAYTINLNKIMVDAFIVFMKKHFNELRGLKKGEIGLSNSQYSNFQNLRYFGLIEMIGNQWFPTEKGFRFFKGYDTIKTPAGMMGGEMLVDWHPAWETHKEGRKDVWIKDYIQEHHDQKEKYQQEKSPILFDK